MMRAKEYLAINNTSLKYPAEIKRIVADMSPLRASREQTVDYYNKHLIPYIRRQGYLLQKDLYDKNNAMQTEAPEPFQMNAGELPVEIASAVRDEFVSDELELDLKISLVPLDGSEITVLPHVEMPEGTRAKIRVTFPDGRVIQPSKVLEALVEVVKYAGADRVRDLGIICCGANLILKNPSPRYQKPCKPVGDGWLCNTCSDTGTKFSQISEISNKLGLGLIVELI